MPLQVEGFSLEALVIWAFTLAPIALMAALRKTRIIFARILGVFAAHGSLRFDQDASVMSGIVLQPHRRCCRLGIEIQIEIVIRGRNGEFHFNFDTDFDFDFDDD
jgi:hypothetical protein